MFEKEKKQYEEDSKKYERPWELWEYKIIGRDAYTDAAHHPHWLSGYHYRRKQTTFVPECYSGLNWRDAEHLIGKTIECTNNPDEVWKVRRLGKIVPTGKNFYVDCASFFTYIRTCEKTFKHPTINICGVELPKPETVAPSNGEQYWLSHAGGEPGYILFWNNDDDDISALKECRIHLTKERAQAWADWWKKEIIAKINEIGS